MKPASTFDHLKSILALPFVVVIVIPVTIHYFTRDGHLNPILQDKTASIFIGVILWIIGGTLFIKSVQLFIKIGKGTLAPWNPTRNLVIQGLYRHLRNPMILGVLILLMAEGFLLKSNYIIIWMVIFALINHIYFIYKEEPDLGKRFGKEYEEYKQNVPRWCPRFKPWRPENIK